MISPAARPPPSLARQYALASSVVLVLAALGIGAAVTRLIEDSVVRNTASATALYLESFLSPISQQLAVEDHLSDNARRALEEVFTNTPLGERVVSYKIWKENGRVVEAADPALVGRSFEVTEELARAWEGEVSASYAARAHEEDAAEVALGQPVLEIYSPIREVWSGDVIAVAEFYEINPELRRDLVAIRLWTWATVLAVVGGIGAVLFAIVLRGSRLIERQRRELDERLAVTQTLSRRNEALRVRVQEAADRSAAATEQSLRRIGADLHDGPAQDLAYAALRLDGLRDELRDEAARADMDAVHCALTRAMGEIRTLSRGLALPELAGRRPDEVVARAAKAHAQRTGEAVALDLPEETGGAHLTQAGLICLYRATQEALNNASRHAGGADLAVSLARKPGALTLSIADRGPGFGAGAAEGGDRLGLGGLRDRVEILGGSFEAVDRPGGGALLRITLPTREDP